VRNVELPTRVCRGYAVVVLCGELDTRDAGDTAAAVAAPAAGEQQLIIDLEPLDFIDCHAAGALLRVRETARQAGGDVLLAAPRGPVLRLLSVLGVPGCPCQCGRRRGQRRRARCPAACGQHRTIGESGAVGCSVPDDGVAGGRPGVACRKPVLVAAVTARAAGRGAGAGVGPG
jgi:anti-anti-sigma factor